jgi:hypothetical protein
MQQGGLERMEENTSNLILYLTTQTRVLYLGNYKHILIAGPKEFPSDLRGGEEQAPQSSSLYKLI